MRNFPEREAVVLFSTYSLCLLSLKIGRPIASTWNEDFLDPGFLNKLILVSDNCLHSHPEACSRLNGDRRTISAAGKGKVGRVVDVAGSKEIERLSFPSSPLNEDSP
jgi:hypothetical protein